MIDFFGSISGEKTSPRKDNKIHKFHAKLTEINIQKSEISDMQQMQMRMKMSLPVSQQVQEASKPADENQRVRRGDSTSLF